jgi:hypothetical protein
MGTFDTKDGQQERVIESSDKFEVRRTIVIGAPGSPKRRVRLDVLDMLIGRLRSTVTAVARDLGFSAAQMPPVELVDLVDGSAGLVLEQSVPAGETLCPLAVTIDAVAARTAGKPLPKLLTESVYDSIDAFAKVCAELGSRNIPIRLEATAPGLPERATVLYPVPPKALVERESPMAIDGEEENVDELPLSADPPESVEERGEWILRLTGKVERLDEKTRRMWLRVAGKFIQLKLDEEKFAVVDRDDARWKQVLVTARALVPELTPSAEVLQVLPADEHLDIEAVAVNEAASGLQPLLDRIEEFGHLPAKWDSYDAHPITEAARRVAKSVLVLAVTAARARHVSPILPFAVPVPRGTVQLEWEQGDCYLELEFFDERHIEYLRSVGEETAEGRATRDRALELVAWFEGSCKP